MLMSQKIFRMNLSLEATSAYILICSLAEEDTAITEESVATFWNGAPEALAEALQELSYHQVIYQAPGSDQRQRYFLNPPELWQDPAE